LTLWPHTANGVVSSDIGATVVADRTGKLSCVPTDTTVHPTRVPADTIRVAECVDLLGKPRAFWSEHRLFLITILAGALGATVHALRSLVWYIGNRKLVWSWLATYLSLPVVGSLLAAVFYMIVRGGLFSLQVTSAFGFAAMGVLIGMFTTPAALKLKDIAETMLTGAQPGANAAPQQRLGVPATPPGGASGGSGSTSPPAITNAERQRRSAGAARDAVLLHGSGFASTTTVQVNGQPRMVEFQSSQALLLPLGSDDLARIDAGGDFIIVVTNPGGTASKPFDFA
jgi:hypothetical protein